MNVLRIGWSRGRAAVAVGLSGALMAPAIVALNAASAQAEEEPLNLATLMDMAPQADLAEMPELAPEWAAEGPVSAMSVPDTTSTFPRAKGKRGNLEIRIKGDRVAKKVRITMLGVSGDATGYSKGFNVGDSRLIKKLPAGGYELTGLTAFSGDEVALSRNAPKALVKAGKTRAVTVKYKPEPRSVLDKKFRTGKFGMKAVAPDAHPYARTEPVELVDPLPHDEKGVRTVFRRGAFHYHPVGQAHYGIANVESFRLTGDRTYLLRAVAQAKHLINTADKGRGGPLFPYTFPFKEMNPIWYSAMAQGQSLTLFSKLAAVTGKKKWRKAADQTFGTLLERGFRRSDDSVIEIRKKNLWLVEYPRFPHENSKLVLNGHMFAMFGVYDYYQLTKDKRAVQVFRGAAQTVFDRFDYLRVPGGISFYSLDRVVQSEYYHQVHVAQLEVLARLTGKQQFLALATTLRADHFNPESVANLSPSQ